MGGCCGGGAAKAMAAQRGEPEPEKVYVNYYPDGSTEETPGEANAQARQRARGGTYRLKS
jgi:sugar (pentulose or hexulose) kinase